MTRVAIIGTGFGGPTDPMGCKRILMSNVGGHLKRIVEGCLTGSRPDRRRAAQREGTSPLRWAIAVISARVRASSLARMLDT